MNDAITVKGLSSLTLDQTIHHVDLEVTTNGKSYRACVLTPEAGIVVPYCIGAGPNVDSGNGMPLYGSINDGIIFALGVLLEDSGAVSPELEQA